MSDMQWNPLSKPPKHEEQTLLHLEYSDGSRGVQQSRGQYVHLYDGSFEDRGQVIGWMPMEPILNAPMMKIIKQGSLPEKRVYTGDCTNCETVFQFERVEAKFVSDQREGDYLEINCPLCHKTVFVSVNTPYS